MDHSDIRDQIRLVMPPEAADVTDAMLTILINQGLQEVSVQADWPFLQADSALSLVDSTNTLTVPNDFQRAMALIDNDHDIPLVFLSPNEYFSRYGTEDDESTTPTRWTLFGANPDIYVNPTPSANDTNRLQLYYYKTITELSADGDIPEFHPSFHWLLVEYAKWKLYERGENLEAAANAFTLYMGYTNDMVQFYSRRVDIQPGIYGYGRRFRRGDPNLPFLNSL